MLDALGVKQETAASELGNQEIAAETNPIPDLTTSSLSTLTSSDVDTAHLVVLSSPVNAQLITGDVGVGSMERHPFLGRFQFGPFKLSEGTSLQIVGGVGILTSDAECSTPIKLIFREDPECPGGECRIDAFPVTVGAGATFRLPRREENIDPVLGDTEQAVQKLLAA